MIEVALLASLDHETRNPPKRFHLHLLAFMSCTRSCGVPNTQRYHSVYYGNAKGQKGANPAGRPARCGKVTYERLLHVYGISPGTAAVCQRTLRLRIRVGRVFRSARYYRLVGILRADFLLHCCIIYLAHVNTGMCRYSSAPRTFAGPFGCSFRSFGLLYII